MVPSSLPTRIYAAIATSYRQGMRSWGQLQVSHRSSYSIERLQAFDNYCQHTSTLRAVVVCMLSPLPALAVAVLIECIPLESPTAGWAGNPSFWIRFALTVVLCIHSITVQAQHLIPGLPIKNSSMIAVSLVASTVYLCSNVALACYWTFPIPFMMVVGGSPALVVWTTLVVGLVGKRELAENPRVKFYLVNFLWFIAFEAGLMIIYPAYNAIFLMLETHWQIAFFCLLPVIKLGLKNVIANFAAHLEDYLPELTVFSVECFNSIYMVVCMQNTSSTTTASIILGLDLVFTVLSLRSLHRRCQTVHDLHSKYFAGASQHAMLTAVLGMTEQPEQFKPEELGLIRLRACIQHRVTSRHKEILDALASHRGHSNEPARRKGPNRVAKIVRKLSRAVTPAAMDSSRAVIPVYSEASKGSKANKAVNALTSVREHHVKLVRHTLRLLFHSEYLALVEYIESTIPLVYVLYISALVHLPNNKYYPRTRGMTDEALATLAFNIGGYGLLEVATFIAFTAIMMRHFGLSPLFQVAFVLETQMQLVQGKLVVWLLFALQFPLVHFGADFSFKFTLAPDEVS